MGRGSRETRILVALWVALVVSCLSLYFAFTEPFDGTWRVYSMRLFSTLTVLLLVWALVQRLRGRRT